MAARRGREIALLISFIYVGQKGDDKGWARSTLEYEFTTGVDFTVKVCFANFYDSWKSDMCIFLHQLNTLYGLNEGRTRSENSLTDTTSEFDFQYSNDDECSADYCDKCADAESRTGV